MTRRSAKDTATILAVMLSRSGQTRARVSTSTLKQIAVRDQWRAAFGLEVIGELAEFGWIAFEIPSGGYGAVRATALEAAKVVTVKRYFNDAERKALRVGNLDVDALEEELIEVSDQDNAEGD